MHGRRRTLTSCDVGSSSPMLIVTVMMVLLMVMMTMTMTMTMMMMLMMTMPETFMFFLCGDVWKLNIDTSMC